MYNIKYAKIILRSVGQQWNACVERLWNYSDRGKPKHSEKNLSHCHFFHHKFRLDWPGIDLLIIWGLTSFMMQ
jgi:hypothetical protein